MKPFFSKKEIDKMMRVAARGKWRGLIPISDVPEFSAWLSDEDHGWTVQSPDEGEAMRIYRDGLTRVILWDGCRTVCGRHIMAMYHTFCCFRNG